LARSWGGGGNIKILELFAGQRCIGRAFEQQGHRVFSIDNDAAHKGINWYADIGNITASEVLERFDRPDVIWASPDCSTYSIAAISHHRTKEPDGNLAPKSAYAIYCDGVNKNVLRLITELRPLYWFIENPRGGLRKMTFMKNLPRYTVTYCQYGDERMKPTDIWTNHPAPGFKPVCRNGATCHTSAPRGSKTGTQGRKGKIERSLIPHKLCDHIAKICISAPPESSGGSFNLWPTWPEPGR
jgi:hypothetical protein